MGRNEREYKRADRLRSDGNACHVRQRYTTFPLAKASFVPNQTELESLTAPLSSTANSIEESRWQAMLSPTFCNPHARGSSNCISDAGTLHDVPTSIVGPQTCLRAHIPTLRTLQSHLLLMINRYGAHPSRFAQSPGVGSRDGKRQVGGVDVLRDLAFVSAGYEGAMRHGLHYHHVVLNPQGVYILCPCWNRSC